MADSSDPALVLDLDFNAVEAQTMRDKSSYQHVAVRSGTGNIYPKPTSGLAFAQAEPFVVSVEDGRGGYDQQSFQVTYVQPLRGNITGKLFDDQSGDGLQQVGEAGLADWIVYQDLNGNQYPDPQEPSTRTTTTGQYTFGKQLPGTYPVRVQPRSGFETPTETTVNVVANQNTIVNFALNELALGQIRGQVTTGTSYAAAGWKVFADLDDNGLLDPAEPFALTDDLGQFAIAGLNAGDYRVRAEMLPGWQVTNPANRVLDVTLASNAIAGGKDFVVTAANTTAASGLQFVTTPNLSGASDSIVAGVTYRYDALAIGLLNQTVTYDLSLATEGMSIDSVTGLVLWRPSLTQVGEQRVILRAMDSQGGVALQDFSLNVSAPNSAPFITSIAPTVGYVGVETRYSIRAQDAENDTLVFNLVSGPATASVDSLTGTLRWIPASGDVGPASFVISVADTSGNVTLRQFTINVSAASPTTTPFTLNPLRTDAAINQAYRSQVDVRDAIGRSLTVSLVSGPTGLTLDSDGNASWVPSTNQLGSQALVVSANDGLGNSQQFTISIAVTQRLVNSAPRITSAPAVYSVANQQYAYDVVAIDAENDELAFELLEAPTGMSINSDSGTLRWLPSRELVGEHAITIQVTDAVGASTLQSYMLRVRSAGGPPQIVSVPSTEAAIGTAWLYSIIATDVEQDPLTYSLLAGPAGVDINPITGELSWTPQSNQLGLNSIAIQVSDGSGGSTSQSFSIRVAAGVPNLPPTISTLPNRFASVGTAYSYLPTATDPEGTPIVYSLSRGPASMTVNPSTGQLNWTPAIGDAGKLIVTLIATDAGGAAAVQSFELDVLVANQTPTIISSPNLSIAAGATWRYSVLGRDADLDPLRYEMLQSPAGATINAFGEVEWSTVVADIGSHSFRFRVSDPRGDVIEQSFTLVVVADTVVPRVTVLPDRVNPFPWGGPIHVYVSAVDNVGIASVTMTVNGIDVPLDANNHAVLYVQDWGFAVLNIVATATDTAGNISTGTGVTFYNDPEVDGDVNAPTAAITSPVESASVAGFVDIIGTAAGANVSGYRLFYRRIDQTDASFIEFATGTTSVTNGVLGRWDTTLLNNDEYIVRLEVSNTSGRTNILDRQVGLSGELKLGNFQLSFTDMIIPVAGIPIEITRIYDTLQADREGDFGYGWRLEYRNTDLRVGLPKSGLEDIGIYSPMRPGVKVYLNVPGQGRQGFTFNPDIRVLPGFGGNNLVLARPRFTPDQGVTSSLSTGTSGYLQVNEFGELFAPGNIPYNPASPDFGGAYVLTTSDGVSYRIDGSNGKLITATDSNKNSLAFTDEKILSSTGVSIAIVRDLQGRVQKIVDPEGNSITYEYEGGDLTRSIDREDFVIEYRYLTSNPHYLDEVIDSLGRIAVRNNYDEFGRLEGQENPLNGRGATFDSLYAPGLSRIVDTDGNETFIRYDSVGRVIETIDALGRSTRSEYGPNGITKIIDPSGGVTTFERNNLGLVTKQTLEDGSVIRRTYDGQGNLTGATNEVGTLTQYQYDNQRNLVSERTGQSSKTYSYDAQGNLIQFVDPTGGVTQLRHNSAGFIVESTNPVGRVTNFQRNLNGLETAQSTIVEDENGVQRELSIRRNYNRNGQETSIVDSQGSTVTQSYDQLGNLSNIVDQTGRVLEYDHRGTSLVHSITFGDGTSNSVGYDDRSNVTSYVDAAGNITTLIYDAVGNILERTVPDATPENGDNTRFTYRYDAMNRLIETVDPEGLIETRIYDVRGQLTEIRGLDGVVSRFAYDALGQIVEETSGSNLVARYEYDERGNRTAVILGNGSRIEYQYDLLDRNISITNPLGYRVLYEYDSLSNLSRVIDENGASTNFVRDEFGNTIKRTDRGGGEYRLVHTDLAQIKQMLYPDGTQVTREYRPDGTLAREINSNGQATTNTHNSKGQISKTEYSDGTEIEFRYGNTGDLVEIIESAGTTFQQFRYENQLAEWTGADGTNVKYEYDAYGLLTQIELDGVRTRYVYVQRQLAEIWRDDVLLSQRTYDSLGRLLTETFANGTSEEWEYDITSRPTKLTIKDNNGLVVQEYQYDFDPNGNLISEQDVSGGIRKYDYDPSGQLVRYSLERNGNTEEFYEYIYDANGNVSLTNLNGQVTQWVYDSASKLLSKLTDGILTTFSYDSDGRLLKAVENGVEKISNQWDAKGRLVSASTLDSGVVSNVQYAYDWTGLMTRRTLNGVVTEYEYDRSGAP